MDIVAFTDEGFVMPTGVMMYSVCVNNKETDITFHVVTNGGSSEDKKKLSDTISKYKGKHIVFYDTNDLDTSDIPSVEKNALLTITTFYRLFLTELLPSDLKKVLYLDGDIINRKSLMPLWEINVDDYAVVASSDVCIMEHSLYERLNYPKEKGYFNSGVMLINLEYWRRNNLISSFKEYMKHNAERIKAYDQDVLNYLLKDCKKVIPVKYNLQNMFLWSNRNYDDNINKEIEDAINDCVFLHFTTVKPWYTTSQHPFRSTFFKYQAQTIWKDAPLIEKRPLVWRIRKWLGWGFRKLHLLPELPSYGKQFIDGLMPID